MGPVLIALLLVLATLLAYLLVLALKVNQFWKSRGIPYVTPLPFIGNSGKLLTMQLNIGDLHANICKQFPNEPVVGFYDFTKPRLLIKDIDLIEKVLIKDFLHFTDHGLPIDDNNPLDANLFTMNGKQWKALRNKLSPIFTSGKLRYMYDSMDVCGNSLVSLLSSENGQQQDVEIKEVLGRFCMDVIGSCAFGIEAGNLAQPDSEFRRMGKKQFQTDLLQFIKFVLVTNFPKIFKKLGISFNKPQVISYFCNIIQNTLNYRKSNNIQRNDFIQMMMQLQAKGYVEIQTKDAEDEYLNIDTSAYKTETFEISDDLIMGQAFTFLTTGFESPAITMTYALYELAKHPKIMDKVKEEILLLLKDGESLTYDAVRDMVYLEQCLKETLRKYPPAVMLFRVCTKEYALPNGFIIPVGQAILIPIKAIHHDPQYYPDPERFQPERFDPDRVKSPCAFLPFGDGPRICIAMRFTMMQMKYALAKLLIKYNFEVSSKTVEPLGVDPKALFTTPKQKLYLNVINKNLFSNKQ